MNLLELGKAFENHLHKEETLLLRTREALLRVHQAIGAGSPRDLAQALQAQDGVLREAHGLQTHRADLQQKLNTTLRAPKGRLHDLTTQLPQEAGARLLSLRRRIRELAATVDHLNRSIAAVSHQQLNFLQRLFADITGAGQHGGCYGPEGRRRDPVCGSLIELRG